MMWRFIFNFTIFYFKFSEKCLIIEKGENQILPSLFLKFIKQIDLFYPTKMTRQRLEECLLSFVRYEEGCTHINLLLVLILLWPAPCVFPLHLDSLHKNN
jgi:hypothetical protein